MNWLKIILIYLCFKLLSTVFLFMGYSNEGDEVEWT